MKIMMVWTFYPRIIENFYPVGGEVEKLDYSCHRKAFLKDSYSWPVALAKHMEAKGHEIEFVVQNDELLQKKWAKEHGCSFSKDNWMQDIVLHQIKGFRPDWLIIPNPNKDVFRYIYEGKCFYKKLAFYIGHDISNKELILSADVLITINSEYVLNIYPDLKNVYEVNAAFDPSILDRLGVINKQYDVVFAGSLSEAHGERVEVLVELLRHGIDLRIYASLPTVGLRFRIGRFLRAMKQKTALLCFFCAVKELLMGSLYEKKINALKGKCSPPVFDLDYFNALASAKVCLNIHIGLSGEISGNIRMYEVTGLGSCLMTDAKRNIGNLFKVGEEIKIFKTTEDLILQLNSSDFWNDVDAVSARGQQRTLKDYSIHKMYARVMQALRSVDV